MPLLLAALLALPAQEEKSEIEALIEKLVSEDRDGQKEAAAGLVGKGKEARRALLKTHRAEKGEVRERVESVILRIDAETDRESAKLDGDLEVHVETSHFEIEISEQVRKKVLHLTLPLRFRNGGEVDANFVLRRATFHTLKSKFQLTVTGPDRKSFAWEVEPGKNRQTSYHSLITPKWKKGTLAVVALEFEVGGKRVCVRSPVTPITVAP